MCTCSPFMNSHFFFATKMPSLTIDMNTRSIAGSCHCS